VHTHQVDFVTQFVEIVEERDQLARPGTIEETDLAKIDSDASLLGFLSSTGLTGERHTAVLIEIALDLQDKALSR
jgi:hypothetical protein